ncbi:MAG: biopolymer transporter ExbD [Oligoflexia bacterium]|nr:biopolymer transporter ExbD [Oligoflexia bacterium]
MKRSFRNEEQTQIDISPLIDMVFILLIFFMVSTTFVKDMKLDLERPGASSATPASSKSIRVYIDNENKVFIDGQLTRVWVLQSKVREMMKSGNIESVLVVTDKNVSADKLLEVVDACRLAGAKDVGVATESEAG